MSSISITIGDWIKGTPPEELAFTNVPLKIKLDDEIITQLSDRESRSLRDDLFIPLYPLAEWIAANWWRLLYECNDLHRRNDLSYEYCHYMRYAGDGYFLPDLRIMPCGNEIVFDCIRRADDLYSFVNSFKTSVPLKDVESEFKKFIELVISRLLHCDIKKTVLQKDWAAINATLRDKEERFFCIAAAQLGLDPYNITEELSDSIISAYELLNNKVELGDYFSAVPQSNLGEITAWMNNVADKMLNNTPKNKTLANIKKEISVVADGETPWAQGYKIANFISKKLFGGKKSTQRLYDFIDSAQIKFDSRPISPLFCNALVSSSSNNEPAFMVDLQENTTKNNFLAGRMLGEYFCNIKTSIVNCISVAKTFNQQRNRAFAAELLAPAAFIKEKLGDSKEVDYDAISELASECQTEEFVIRYQIQNHHLAKITPQYI